MKKTAAILMIGLIALMIRLAFGTLKASEMTGFPVPLNAKAKDSH
ncbi:hypothetical protein [Salipaludibacillus sp. LMS25]|jgi:hypothetical protein|nr:hypothetical protein [Salipaludibacillus sp. LMS25]